MMSYILVSPIPPTSPIHRPGYRPNSLTAPLGVITDSGPIAFLTLGRNEIKKYFASCKCGTSKGVLAPNGCGWSSNVADLSLRLGPGLPRMGHILAEIHEMGLVFAAAWMSAI